VTAAAGRLFPIWQALLIGVPIGLIAASIFGLALALVVALPLGAVIGPSKPSWFGHVSEAVAVGGAAVGLWLVMRWLRGRRAGFATLVRTGELLPAEEVEKAGLARALGTRAGVTIARLALGGAVGSTIAQIYGGPVACAVLDGEIVEARTAADARGRFRFPELMLVDRRASYVALLHRAGWIIPQRVLRRRPAPPAT